MNDNNIFLQFYLYLTKAIDFLNKRLFNNLFDKYVFLVTIADIRSNKIAHFKPRSWKIKPIKSEEKMYPEIIFNGEYLLGYGYVNIHDMYTILATLVHELIHFEHNLKNIQGTSKTGFHNKHFKETGEKYGLVFDEKHKRHGWSSNTPSESLKRIFDEFIKENPFNFEVFHRNRPLVERTKPKKTYYKFTCEGCNKSVKAKLETNLMCGDCNLYYEFDDKLDDGADLEELLKKYRNE